MMQRINFFTSGYLKTILFAIEYKPKFQFPQEMFIIPHFVHHAQIAGLILKQNNQDAVFNYFVQMLRIALVEPILTSSLKLICLWMIFIYQIILLIYLLVVTQYTQAVMHIPKQRLQLEKQVETVNSILHWYFTFYSVFTMAICSVCLEAQNAIGYVATALQFIQGMILIYLLRNHRFAENNCFKRRFAISQMINYTLQYALVLCAYTSVDLIILYGLTLAYGLIQIIDQFYTCPYRDPFREPSLKISLVLLWTVALSYIYEVNPAYNGLFFWLFVGATVTSGFADVLSSLFHEYAMSNYNSKTNLQEKYIIIGVDQFYSNYVKFQVTEQTKLMFFQQLAKHKENCTRSKCATQKVKLSSININDKNQLHKLTLDVVSCIFKTCHSRTVMRKGILIKPKFEQLQLQYISFLSITCQRPLLAYVELRAYQVDNNRSNSLYFRELTSKISTELEFQILYLQDRMVQQQFRKEKFIQQEEKLNIAMLWKSINFYQYITPKIIEILSLKQTYWNQLMQGYNDLKPLQEEQLHLYDRIDIIYKDIQNTIYIPEAFFDRSKDISKATISRTLAADEQNINILNLKIYSILYAIILNDFDRAFQAEKQIEELIKEDRQKSDDMIDDQAIQRDNALIILISLVRKKGHIVNRNLLTLANFFEYSNVQEIQNVSNPSIQQSQISAFLPPDMSPLHDELLNGFISSGYTKYSIQSIHSYFVQKQGFLRECYIKINNLFQDPEDFILTGSVMRKDNSYQSILFDSFGKIIGVSEQFFDQFVKSNNPNMTLERLREEGHIFIFMPFLLGNLKQLATTEREEYTDFSFTFDDLQDLNTQFMLTFLGKNKVSARQLSSYNLSTIRSQITHRSEQYTDRNDEDCLKIQNIPIPLLNQERMIAMLEHLITHYKNKQYSGTAAKVKYSIQFQCIKTKKTTFPYFVMSLENLSEFETLKSIKNSSYVTQLRRTLNYLKFGEQSTITTEMTKIKTMNNDFQTLNKSQDLSEHPSHQESVIPPSQIHATQLQINITEIVPQQSQIMYTTDNGIQFCNPIIDRRLSDNFDFDKLDQELKDESNILMNQSSQLNQEQVSYIIPKQENEHEDILDAKYQSEYAAQKSVTSNVGKKADNVLDVYRQNIQNVDHYVEQVGQSSKASSSKTTSSKSPYLLIRLMYSRGARNIHIKSIIVLNVLIATVILTLLFVKVFVVQSQYKNLQNNLNYVQHPETLNNYFLKATMYSYNILQQQLKLVNYSKSVNSDIMLELKTLSLNVESTVTSIYDDIIQFEESVIKNDTILYIVNELNEFQLSFDLTMLLEQLSRNIISIYQYLNSAVQLTNDSISNILFFRLNLLQVSKTSSQFITYLNNNLLYYESQITVSLTYIIVVEVCSVTMLILVQLKIWTDINDYVKRMLILTTKLSEDDALSSSQNLQHIKAILEDPQQILWKTTNYVTLVFDTRKPIIQKTFGHMQSVTTSKVSSIIQSMKLNKRQNRKYQNSSLTSRIYNLKLTQYQNYLLVCIMWIILMGYLMGALGYSISMISSIKPAIDLNLQLIQFKLQFDSIVTFGELTKTDQQIQQLLIKKFPYNFTLEYKPLNDYFTETLFVGFSDKAQTIYDSLSSSSSLISSQKQTLLIPFQESLCLTNIIIPSCSTGNNILEVDNSFLYVSQGIVAMVSEISKTIKTNLNLQLTKSTTIEQTSIIMDFLTSQVHRTEFVQHFLYQGKILEQIASQMLQFNGQTLTNVLTQFQIYVYVVGLSMLVIYAFVSYKWVLKIERQLYLQKLALTLIPAEFLMEQKTLTELKVIQGY